MKITSEQDANEALKGIAVGNIIRITFKADVGEKFQQRTFLRLQHRLEFDTMWLAVAHNQLAVYGIWGSVPRIQDFKVRQINDVQKEVFAHEFTPLAESIEIL
ncbi:MAG: hypothetical protein A2365_01950 [Candidatus Nealsonbacteria bacterium RIFOXYB1_FULL_40_15]|uniref:Uncharacterized protein n=2 Tax=Candidatus Nealsoniibacteriota TaxID=1817911 RepID=A0A1G2EV22_9BACT|nr:MAG: hypothetical protein A2365_01950 [Candidatus Nealsonbacteria bacterium RIFOXYB1_FULL_40_15]OGZ29094.1 MAG: hypothetical protein A2562_01515 [Candidatus Nealsonbacteria bacterium RIFOXYD1_FULL_39_11]OGZ29118.1 MAG: hypothetical protein A2427_02400 [Candidatus Nealsonbacteria bacterium RIFOXYC1_FULL_40_7]